MSLITDILCEQAEVREKEVVAWAIACGTADGLQAAVNLLREEAGKLFAKGKDDDARLVRELAAQVDSRRKAVGESIPPTPNPTPITNP